MSNPLYSFVKFVIGLAVAGVLASCGGAGGRLPSAQFVSPNEGPGPNYIIGPLDNLQIFVWRNPELSTSVTVRPDGRISVPLIEDLAATGTTPTGLARNIEDKLKVYIQNPIVTVIVSAFQGPFAQQVRVVGEAANPQAIPYRANMTLLDVMIAVGGMTEFASGNRARLIRFDNATGRQTEYAVRIDSLLKDGDISANVRIEPGDVIIIPESFF
ncbi:MAG: XrtA/PEP-CTERM system exopolysaccharide export protein [Pseudomonadota bacterium]